MFSVHTGIPAEVDESGLKRSWPTLCSKEEQISAKQNDLEEEGVLKSKLKYLKMWQGGAASCGAVVGTWKLSELHYHGIMSCFIKGIPEQVDMIKENSNIWDWSLWQPVVSLSQQKWCCRLYMALCVVCFKHSCHSVEINSYIRYSKSLAGVGKLVTSFTFNFTLPSPPSFST